MPEPKTINLTLPINVIAGYVVTPEKPHACIHGVQMGPCYPCREILKQTPIFHDDRGPVYKDDLDANALRDGRLVRGK